MSKDFVKPPALERGDKVAIVGVGNGAAKNVFPEVYDLGLERLREIFDLEPVEFPTVDMTPDEKTANPKKRAEDLMDAFKRDDIKGVIAPIGGTGEQIRVLKYLDPKVLRENPTRFYGYSDNTSLNNYLWNQGIISFQGPMIMSELAMQGKMHEYTVKHSEKAFFEDSLGQVEAPDQFTDENLEWGEPENLEKHRELEDHPGLEWHNFDDKNISGRTWGGCLEVVSINLSADNYIPDNKDLEGNILVIETSEELPEQIQIDDFMLGLGERGLLEKFSAIIVGMTKARSHLEEPSKDEREEYRKNQRESIKKWAEVYNSDLPILFNLNFGHTDPIIPMPIGGEIEIRPENKEIEFL